MSAFSYDTCCTFLQNTVEKDKDILTKSQFPDIIPKTRDVHVYSMNVSIDNMHKCLVLFFNKIKTETLDHMGTTGGGGGGGVNFTTGKQPRTPS